MQQEGQPKFFKHHQGAVRGVAFSPKDRYLFCSGGHDGKVNIYSAARLELLLSYQITSLNSPRSINAVRFTSDGRKILAATTARRLAVLDVERGEQVMCYDNCAFNGRDRAPLACDPICPHLAVCSCVNGKGLTLFDLRMPLPLDFVFDLHSNLVRDITFIHSSWPFVKNNQSALVSLSCDGVCKVTTLDGRFLHCFEVGHSSNSVAPTPEPYGSALENGFTSVLMVGGDMISSYMPETGVIKERIRPPIPPKAIIQEFPSPLQTPGDSPCSLSMSPMSEGIAAAAAAAVSAHTNAALMNLCFGQALSRSSSGSGLSTPIPGVPNSYPSTPILNHSSSLINNNIHISGNSHLLHHQYALHNHHAHHHHHKSILSSVWKLRYTSNGSQLFAACDGGAIRRYRRWPDHHEYLGDLFSHKSDVQDMDVSPYDEFLVTASKDKTVGLICLGSPNHGWTHYCELS